MRKKILALSILVIGIVSTGFCQNRTLTGKITSAEDKQPVPGVTVKVTGTNTGTQTNVDGQYSVEVGPEAKSLTFSLLGFVQQEVQIGDKTSLDVELKVDQKKLDEVVVVGYGVQSKKDVTGAISSIKGDVIRDIPVQSFDQALAGKAAGVNITIPNGVLNNAPVIRIRGFNSITSSSYPLIVMDGVPVFTGDQSSNSAANNPLGDINPADIESIDILKDASATAIYGSRAANGVMIITTKKGKEGKDGKAAVNFNSSMGISKVINLPEPLNATDYMTIKNEARENTNFTGTPLAPAFNPDYDANGNLIDTRWYDHVFRTGISHNNYLSIAGASANSSYYFSAGYTKQDGFIKNNEFQRKSVRFNVDQKIAKIIKVGANITFTDNFNSAPNTGSLPGEGFNTSGLARLAFVTAPNVSPYTNSGGYNITATNLMGQNKNTLQSGFANPIPLIDLNRFTSESSHLLASFFAEVDLYKGLTFKSYYSLDNNSIEGISYQSPLHGDGFTNKGVVNNVLFNINRWSLSNYLSYQKTLAEKHTISLVAGQEQVYTKRDGWGGSRQNVADDFFDTYQGNYLTNNPPVGNLQSENGFASYFGRVTYDLKKKYFLTGSFRRDGFSGLSEGNKYGNFGGASAGWAISEEEFYKNLSFTKTLNSVKLRASYGKVGNIFGLADFGSLSLYNSGLYADVNTLSYSQTGNSELKWETSTKMDIGLNVGILQDRIQVEFSYFNNDINGLILNAPQSPSKGIPGNSILLNVGSMFNKGIELSVHSTNIDKGKFVWTSNINIALITNEVSALSDGADIVGTTSTLERTNITRVGYSVGSIYAVKTDGVNPENGRRIFFNADGSRVQYSHVVPTGQQRWTYMEDHTDNKGVFHAKGATAAAINPATDAVVIGSAIPKWFGGFNNTLTYKDFDMGINITFSGGNYIYNGSKAGMRDMRFWNNNVEVMDRWTSPGQETNIPRVVFGDNVSNGSSFPISENVEKGDYLKLKNISLGYTIKEDKLGKTGISSLRVYAQVTNLYTLTKYTGYDPEVSTNGNSNLTPGVDRNTAPNSITYTFGLNVAF